MLPDDDDELLKPLPELDGDDDEHPENTGLGEAWAELTGLADPEAVGLDDATGAGEPVDPAWLDALPDDLPSGGDDDQRLEGFDPGVDLDAGEGESWLESGGRETRFDAGDDDLEEAPPGGDDDGGALGLEDWPGGLASVEDDEADEDAVDLPSLGGRDELAGRTSQP